MFKKLKLCMECCEWEDCEERNTYCDEAEEAELENNEDNYSKEEYKAKPTELTGFKISPKTMHER